MWTLGSYAGFLHWKVTTFPLLFVRTRVTQAQPTLTGKRRLQLHLRESEALKNLWTCVHVKTTRAINKYFGGDAVRLCNSSIFSINFCSFILAFLGGSCLQRLYYHGVQVAIFHSSDSWLKFFYTEELSLFPYLFSHLFRSVRTQKDVYFILWFPNSIPVLLILLCKLSHLWPLGGLSVTRSMTVRWGNLKGSYQEPMEIGNNEERIEQKMSQLNNILEPDFRER